MRSETGRGHGCVALRSEFRSVYWLWSWLMSFEQARRESGWMLEFSQSNF